MIFGFNTDVKVQDTVYHVQSEERTAEKVLQSQIFVRGQCVAKHAVPFSDADSQSDEARHERLREQHRTIVQAIREGRIRDYVEAARLEAIAGPGAAAPAAAPATAPQLELKFLGSDRPANNSIVFRFAVAIGKENVQGATVMARILPEAAATETFSGGAAVQAVTSPDGVVEMTLPIPPNAQGMANLVVHVAHQGITLARKFKVKTRN